VSGIPALDSTGVGVEDPVALHTFHHRPHELGNPSFQDYFFLSLYTLYALKTLQLSAGALGVIISVGGLGALMGTALAGRMSHRLGLGPALILCLGGSQLAGLLIPLARGPSGWP
jgi:MFS family permease